MIVSRYEKNTTSPPTHPNEGFPHAPTDTLWKDVTRPKQHGVVGIQGAIVDFSSLHAVDTTITSMEDRRRLRLNHNVFNEVDNIRRQLESGLDPVHAWEFPYAQARGLISEFASGFGNETRYHIRGGKMYAPGNSISTSEALSTHATMAGKREMADAKGFTRIEQVLMTQPEGTMVVQLSPPSITPEGAFEAGYGAYGFLNIFRKVGSDVLANHIIYQENPGLTRTNTLYSSLQKDRQNTTPRIAEDYIQEPLAIPKQDVSEVEVMSLLGLSQEWKRYLEDRVFFERHILQDPHIRKWLHAYVTSQVMSATSCDPNFALQAETFLIAAYNRARSLTSERGEMGGESAEKREHRVIGDDRQDGAHMLVQYASQKLHMEAGSCPISYEAQTTLSSRGFITYEGISKSFATTSHEFGKSHEGWLRRDCVTCPMDGCGFVSTKQRPHLYHEQEKRWICANPQCREHNPDIYKKVMSAV